MEEQLTDKKRKAKFVAIEYAARDARFFCTICSTYLNSKRKIKDHNGGRKHKKNLSTSGLQVDHHEYQYLKDLEVLEPLAEDVSNNIILTGERAKQVLKEFKKKGVDIPDFVKRVVKVKKTFDYKSVGALFNYEECLVTSQELIGSCVLIDEDEVVGICIPQGIEDNDCIWFNTKLQYLWKNGAYVNRSLDKFAGEMVMFGYRIVKDLGRYSHPQSKRKKQEDREKESRSKEEEAMKKLHEKNKRKLNVKDEKEKDKKKQEQEEEEKEIGKDEEVEIDEEDKVCEGKRELPSANELETISDDVANRFFSCLKALFPQRIQKLFDLYQNDDSNIGRMGNTPFSGMGVTKNYSTFPHLDVQDLGFCFIAWFLEGTEYIRKGFTSGGEFVLPEYKLYFRPQHGSIFVLNASKVYHGTRKNLGFTQVAMASYIKQKLVDCAKRRIIGIGVPT